MKITLITACWNCERTIGDALASVRGQRLAPGVELEHIVVDGASADGTVGILRAAETAAESRGEETRGAFSYRWLSERDRGMYDAINKGIGRSSGDVIGILNSDDVLDGDDIVSRVAAAFEEAPELECRYANVRFVRELGGPTRRVCFARWWRPWMLQWGYMPPHPGVFIRRECFAKWGLYAPDKAEYSIAADDELLIRFFRVNKMRSRYLRLCTTVMRTGGMSTRNAGAVAKLNAEVIKANRANGYFCCWPMLLPKYAVKIWEVILPRIGFGATLSLER